MNGENLMLNEIPMGSLVLEEEIGRGGYGVVHKAKLQPFERSFAVKLFDPSPFHSDPDKEKRRFIREAEILMDLRHPNITPIYGVGEFNGKSYIVMEYFKGFNLNQAREIGGSPLPVKTLKFVEFVASALEYAHQNNIVHRDIKPSNLLTCQGDARVVDFGISYIMDPTGERFTQTGATPVGDAYAAPELIDDPRLVDPRCDIYSLGACWFWLLTGTTPRGRSWEAALRAVEGMEPSYENVILKALDAPDKRYQTMDQLVHDVRALRTGINPKANLEGQLNDEVCLLLGIIFAHYSPEKVPISVYRLEQELANKLNRFALAIGLSTLRRRQLVEDIENNYDQQYSGLGVTPAGDDWVSANSSRVEKLIQSMTEPVQADETNEYDDIPF
jgi:serine/threonine protein kinase